MESLDRWIAQVPDPGAAATSEGRSTLWKLGDEVTSFMREPNRGRGAANAAARALIRLPGVAGCL